MSPAEKEFSHAEARGTPGEEDLDSIMGAVIDVAIPIHRDLGPGLLESVYEMVMARKLESLGYRVQRQFPVSFEYDGFEYVDGFRVDLLVNDRHPTASPRLRVNQTPRSQQCTYF